MLITSKCISTIDKLKKDLSSEFKIKNLSEAKKVLSMDIEHDRKGDKVSLTQKGYLKKVLSEIQHQRRYEVCKYNISPSF